MSTKPFKLRIVIVGAGLGGLSAAIACALADHDVIVLEGAKQLAEVRRPSLEDRAWLVNIVI